MSCFDNPSGKSVGPTRPFVPFMLNGRIYTWMFAPWKNEKCLEQITVEIPMKYYPKVGEDWVARQVFITFIKKEHSVGAIYTRPDNTKEAVRLVQPEEVVKATEIAYVCNTDKMYYDNEGAPVAKTGKEKNESDNKGTSPDKDG